MGAAAADGDPPAGGERLHLGRVAGGIALALASGAAGWAAHPPVGWWWASFVVVPLLLAAIEVAGARSWRRAALVGAVSGATTYLPLVSWLALSAGTLGWLGLGLVMSTWHAVLAVAVRPWVRSRWLPVAVPVLWAGLEGWRGALAWLGFGWGTLDVAHVDGSWLLPLARLVGSSGILLATVAIGVLAYVAVRAAPSARRGRVATAAGALVGLALVAAAPTLAPDAPPATGRTIDVLAVQGNDLEGFRGDPFLEDAAIAQRMLLETRESVVAHGRPDLTIWPESSLDRDPYTRTGADLRPYLDAGAAFVGGDLLAGVNLDGPDPLRTFRNAAVVVDDDGTVEDLYVKRRYVPFGEYVPLRPIATRLIPLLRQIPRDGVPGPGPASLRAGGTSVAVAICYESGYRDVVAENIRAGDAELVTVITNDAAFGRTAQVDQHLAQSRMRAVETGRWVVHAGLSGTTAVIDPDGRVLQRTPLFERTSVRADVPLVAAPTPFLRHGDVLGDGLRWAAVGLLVLAGARGLRARRHAR